MHTLQFAQSGKHELKFYDKRNEQIMAVEGTVRRDHSAIVVWSATGEELKHAVKVACTFQDGSHKEYRIVGRDREQRRDMVP